VNEAGSWDAFLAQQTDPHILQTREWGELKSRFGWSAQSVAQSQAGALLLFRRLPFGLTLAYLPRGPVPSTGEALALLLPEFDRLARRHRAVGLIVEPDIPDDPSARAALSRMGLSPSSLSVQPPRTVTVDLSGSEEQILGRLKQKTRYNINLARRHGVQVRESGDTDAFSQLMSETTTRDGFAAHAPHYYRDAYDLFSARDGVRLLFGEHEGQRLAALMAFAVGRRAWYFYGASSNVAREKMAPYLVQWEARRWAKSRGCTSYDVGDVPDFDEASPRTSSCSAQLDVGACTVLRSSARRSCAVWAHGSACTGRRCSRRMLLVIASVVARACMIHPSPPPRRIGMLR
jgi:lipid II:glycine glycyltransferase (peptidoglycan interpeptide bridge formation enzyme)